MLPKIHTINCIQLSGRFRVLPASALRENWVLPPRAMDGIPAPISKLADPMDALNAKIIVEEVKETETETEGHFFFFLTLIG